MITYTKSNKIKNEKKVKTLVRPKYKISAKKQLNCKIKAQRRKNKMQDNNFKAMRERAIKAEIQNGEEIHKLLRDIRIILKKINIAKITFKNTDIILYNIKICGKNKHYVPIKGNTLAEKKMLEYNREVIEENVNIKKSNKICVVLYM